MTFVQAVLLTQYSPCKRLRFGIVGCGAVYLLWTPKATVLAATAAGLVAVSYGVKSLGDALASFHHLHGSWRPSKQFVRTHHNCHAKVVVDEWGGVRGGEEPSDGGDDRGEVTCEEFYRVKITISTTYIISLPLPPYQICPLQGVLGATRLIKYHFMD